MLQRGLDQIQDQQLKKNQLYLPGPIGKKPEIETGFQSKDTEVAAEENITPGAGATEALTEGGAAGDEGTPESTLSTGTASLALSMCPRVLSDSARRVKLAVRALTSRLFPKEDDSEVPRQTQTVKFTRVQATRTV